MRYNLFDQNGEMWEKNVSFAEAESIVAAHNNLAKRFIRIRDIDDISTEFFGEFASWEAPKSLGRLIVQSREDREFYRQEESDELRCFRGE